MLRRAEGFKQIGRSLRRIATAAQLLTHSDKSWLVAARGLGDPSPSFSGSRVQCMSQSETLDDLVSRSLPCPLRVVVHYVDDGVKPYAWAICDDLSEKLHYLSDERYRQPGQAFTAGSEAWTSARAHAEACSAAADPGWTTAPRDEPHHTSD